MSIELGKLASDPAPTGVVTPESQHERDVHTSPRQSEDLTREDDINVGARVTRSQQTRILLSTCLSSFTIVGLTQAFGVFQAHYGQAEILREGIMLPHQITSRAWISSIGSLGNGGIVFILAVAYYPHLPQIGQYIRLLCSVGAMFTAFGWYTAAISRNLAALVCCQGILVGIGAGIQLSILTPILPEYFPERSGLAQGVMFAAAGVGGTAWTFALTALLELVGARNTLFAVSGITGLTLTAASMLALPPRRFEKRNTHMLPWKTFTDPMFASLCMVNLIHPLTLAVPMAFGPEFVESIGGQLTYASQLLAINSGVGVPARLLAGALADRIGHQNTLLLATIIYVFATWTLWLLSAVKENIALFIAMSICHGIVSGVFNIVMNTIQKVLFGAEMYYPKNGATTTIRGIGYVLGVPIVGALVKGVADDELKGPDFIKAIVYMGTLLTISVACLVLVRILDARRTGFSWVR